MNFLKPTRDTITPAGYTYSLPVQNDSKESQRAIAKAAQKVLDDPLLLRVLTDRVYELMQEDLRNQRERSRNYGGSF